MGIFKRLSSISWTTIVSGASAFAVKFFLIALFLFLVLVVVRGLREDGYKVQAIQVPKKYEDAGFSGQVIAFMIADKVGELKKTAKTVRVDSLDLNVDMGQDLTMDVMGVGLSAESIIHHVRELLGRQNYTIGGEITDMDGIVSYNVRMTGYNSEHIEVPYSEGFSREALNRAIDLAALKILNNTDPYRLALVYYHRNDLEACKEVLREMITTKPMDRKWAYHLWGNVAQRERKKDVAEEYFLKSIEEDDGFVLPLTSLAWTAFEEKNYQQGLDYFLQILKHEPMHRSAHNGASLCFRNLGDLDKSESHLKTQMENFPDNIYSYGNYSYFLIQYRNDTAGAIQLYEEASKNIPVSGDLYVALSSFNMMIGDTVKALQNIYQTLELDPDNVLALRSAAGFEEMKNKDYKKAEVYYKRHIAEIEKKEYDSSMKSSGYNSLAIVEYQQGKLDSALFHANKAIEAYPANPFPWSTLAEVYLLKGDQKGFYENIEKAITLGFDVTKFLDEYPYSVIKDRSKLYRIIENQKENLAIKG